MKKRVLLAVALLAIFIVSWSSMESLTIQATPRSHGNESASELQTPPIAGAARETGPVELRSASERDDTKLPSEQAPFSGSYLELKRLADGGSPRAACRLAFELLRCQAFTEGPAVREALEHQERADEHNGFALAANMSASKQIEVANRTADCRKLPPGAYANASSYLYRAATAGNLAARVRYIRGQMFGSVAIDGEVASDLGYMHHPEFERWRRIAPAMANELLHSHPWVGVQLLSSAYLADDQVFDALVPDDEVQAWAYGLAVREARGAPPMDLDRFDAGQKQRLETLRRKVPRLDAGDEARDGYAVDAMVAPAASLGEWSNSGCSN